MLHAPPSHFCEINLNSYFSSKMTKRYGYLSASLIGAIPPRPFFLDTVCGF
jgi:hypothetical protein